jgi:molybdate-binding protein
MRNIQRIHSEDILKVLRNPTRLAILRLLITRSATITQLGEILQQHPAQIRNHLKQLEKAEMVQLESVQTVKNFLEKYYRATARAYFISMAVLPEPLERGQILLLGSDDPALDLLASQLNRRMDAPELFILPVGSLDGLIYLREQYCQMTSCHLFDQDSGEYNVPFVRFLFADRPMTLVNLAYRQQGLLICKGNPQHISGIADLGRENLTFINRNRGSGTRQRLDQHLRMIGLDPRAIAGYEVEVFSHCEIARAISAGQADVGLGIFSAADQHGLDFIPLFEERYDLVMSEAFYRSPQLQLILESLQSPEFKAGVQGLKGYNLSHSGEVIQV